MNFLKKVITCCWNSKSYDIIDQGTNLPLNAINQISESDSIIEIPEKEAEKECVARQARTPDLKIKKLLLYPFGHETVYPNTQRNLKSKCKMSCTVTTYP